MKHVPPYAGVERGDLVKEVKCFTHNSSKVFHYLGMEHGAGIYCGGEPLVLASVTILIVLLKSQGCLSGLVDIVDRTGKVVLKVEGGVLTMQILLSSISFKCKLVAQQSAQVHRPLTSGAVCGDASSFAHGLCWTAFIGPFPLDFYFFGAFFSDWSTSSF